MVHLPQTPTDGSPILDVRNRIVGLFTDSRRLHDHVVFTALIARQSISGTASPNQPHSFCRYGHTAS